MEDAPQEPREPSAENFQELLAAAKRHLRTTELIEVKMQKDAEVIGGHLNEAREALEKWKVQSRLSNDTERPPLTPPQS